MRYPWMLVAWTLLHGCVDQGVQNEDELDLLLANVTVIDGAGSASQPNRTIEIVDGRIRAVRPSTPTDTSDLSVVGGFVTPGLIDSHVHLPDAESDLFLAIDSLLDRGITSVRDMACCAPDFAQVESVSDSLGLSRLHWSVLWAGPTYLRDDPRVQDDFARAAGAPWIQAVSAGVDLTLAARGARESGATGIKIYSDMAPGLVRASVQAAHATDLPVWSHAVVFPTRPLEVVESGVDVVSHAGFLVWQVPEALPVTYNGGHPWNPFGPPAPYDTVSSHHPEVLRVLEAMLERDVVLDPTISVMGLLSPEARAWAVEIARQAHAMGVPLVVGTDYSLFADEAEALVYEVGMTPLEVLASATSIGARVLRRANELGSVEAGKLADLVIYSADPSQDISVLRSPRYVIRGGKAVRPR